jgi:CubicO group peptidase (beta-lactamase class C family)
MYKLRSAAIVAILIGTMSACSSGRGDDIDAILTAYQGNAVPGAALRIIQRGQVILTRGYGAAETDSQTPVTAATNFRLASITKQFTATSILMLIEEGLLDLDTTLPQIFDDFPAYGDNITVKQVLQHRSGLLDYESIMPEGVTEQAHDSDVLRMMIESDHTYFEPGSEYRYSNSGYALLAMIVTKLSGKSFAAFLHERIFTPVGMKNTVAFEDGVSTVPNRAWGYTVKDGIIESADQSPYSAVLGDGGIYSSLDDLFLWDQAQYRDDLISAESRALMQTPALEIYGFGLRIDEFNGHHRYHHEGSTSGFRNFMMRFPDLELTVILLTNRAAPSVTPLAEKIATLYLP